MSRLNKLILITTFFCLVAKSENSDAASKDALEKTKQMLMDPAQRAKAIAGKPEAEKLDQDMNNMLGSNENVEKIYALAAEILGKMAAESGNDPEKLKQMLKEAGDNPAAFAESWDQQQKDKLKAIAEKVPAANQEAIKSSAYNKPKSLPYDVRIKK